MATSPEVDRAVLLQSFLASVTDNTLTREELILRIIDAALVQEDGSISDFFSTKELQHLIFLTQGRFTPALAPKNAQIHVRKKMYIFQNLLHMEDVLPEVLLLVVVVVEAQLLEKQELKNQMVMKNS